MAINEYEISDSATTPSSGQVASPGKDHFLRTSGAGSTTSACTPPSRKDFLPDKNIDYIHTEHQFNLLMPGTQVNAMNRNIHDIVIGIFLSMIPLLLLTSCHTAENGQERNLESDAKKTPTYREMMNLSLNVDFGNEKKYEVVFQSDSSFYWKSMRSGNQSTEATKTIILDDYRVLTHWVEKDSTIVSILTDFESMQMNGFETFNNQNSIYLIGEFTVAE